MNAPLNIETKILDKRLGAEFPLPAYATDGAAGLDLRACLPAPAVLAPGETMLVGSGIAVSIRAVGYMAMLAARSGLAVKHGIVLANAVGIVDSDYQDEIRIPLRNSGGAPYTINPGDRICQLIIVPVVQAVLKPVKEFAKKTPRHKGGFGSTGVE